MPRPCLYALCAAVFGAVGLLWLADPGPHTALFAIVAVACAAVAARTRRAPDPS